MSIKQIIDNNSVQTPTDQELQSLYQPSGTGKYFSRTKNALLNISEMQSNHIKHAISSLEKRANSYVDKLRERQPYVYQAFRTLTLDELTARLSPVYTDLKKAIETKEQTVVGIVTGSIVNSTPLTKFKLSESAMTNERVLKTLRLNGIETLEVLATYSLLDFATMWLVTAEAAYNLTQALAGAGLNWSNTHKVFDTQCSWPVEVRNEAKRTTLEEFRTSLEKAVNEAHLTNTSDKASWTYMTNLVFERVKARLTSIATIYGKQLFRRRFDTTAFGTDLSLLDAKATKKLERSILKQLGERLQALGLEADMNDRVSAYCTRTISKYVQTLKEY